jgi:hypothetical protein
MCPDGYDVNKTHHCLARWVLGKEPENKLRLQEGSPMVKNHPGTLGMLGEYVHLCLEISNHCEQHICCEQRGISSDADRAHRVIGVDQRGHCAQPLRPWGQRRLIGRGIKQ